MTGAFRILNEQLQQLLHLDAFVVADLADVGDHLLGFLHPVDRYFLVSPPLGFGYRLMTQSSPWRPVFKVMPDLLGDERHERVQDGHKPFEEVDGFRTSPGRSVRRTPA